MPLLNWLHLTDWHQGRTTDFNRKIVTDALLEDIRERAKIHLDLAKIDFLFFTGDLAFKGAKGEYEAAIKEFLDPVVEALGIDKSRVITIPGNHDIDRSRIKYLGEELRKPIVDPNEQVKILDDEEYREQILKPFKEYDAFVKVYEHVGFEAFGGFQSFDHEGAKVGVFGCNSALMCARNMPGGEVNDLGYLLVSEHQYHSFRADVKDCDLVFGLVHHPTSWLAPIEQTKVEKFLHEQAQFVLMGHEHNHRQVVVPTKNNECMVIGGGATYEKRTPDHPVYTIAYSFGSYDLAKGKGRLFLRQLNLSGDGFRADFDRTHDGAILFELKSKAQEVFKAPKGAAKPTTRKAKVDLDKVRKTYLDSIVERYRNLDQRGVQLGAHDKPVELDTVYVTLNVEAKKDIEMQRRYEDLLSRSEHYKDIIRERNLADDPELAKGSKELDDNLERLHQAMQQESQVQTKDLAQLIREGHRSVILGDPGAGKTTLAKFVTRHYAHALLADKERVIVEEKFRCDKEKGFVAETITYDYGKARLPILVRVGDYAEALKKYINAPLIGFLPAGVGDCQANASEIKVLFEDALAKGEAFVILDGLDEVTEDGIRSTVSRRIDDFVSGGGKHCPILITSRKTGFEKARPTGSFDVSTIQDMELDQVREFVSRRIMAFERAQTGVTDHRRLYEAGKEEIGKIMHAIETNEGVRRLSVNPLLVTILCLIHRSNKSLPKRRVELYRLASETLLTHWRVAQTGDSSSAMSLDEADIYLAPLAEWMHKNLDNGLIPRDIAREKITDIAVRRLGKDKDHPDVFREVEAIWRKLSYDTSVFVDRGDDHFAFLHLTFEEYWAARQLVRDSFHMADEVRKHRKDARFREVIRLAVASQSPENATRLIRSAIWCPADQSKEFGYQPSLYEAELHRDFELACECLADCSSIDPGLVKEVASEAGEIWDNLPDIGFGVNLLGLIGPTDVGQAISLSISTKRLSNFNILALQYLARPSQTVDRALIEALQDVSSTIRASAALTFREYSRISDEARKALLSCLYDKDDHVVRCAADSLAATCYDSMEAIEAFIDMLKRGNVENRRTAALQIGRMKNGINIIVPALLDALLDNDSTVPFFSAESLKKLSKFDSSFMDKILGELIHGSDRTRACLAFSLGYLGDLSDTALLAVINALNDVNANVRSLAAQSIGQIGNSSPIVIEGLLNRFNDPDPTVRFQAINSIDRLDVRLLDVSKKLLKVIREDSDSEVRGIAVGTLWRFRNVNDEVEAVLLKSLNDDVPGVQLSAIKSLGLLRKASGSILRELIRFIENESPGLRGAAVDSLGKIGYLTEDVEAALLVAIHDEDPSVSAYAARALGEINSTSPETIRELLVSLQSQNDSLQSFASISLQNIKHSDSIIQPLLALLEDSKFTVRICAIECIKACGDNSEAVIRKLLDLLGDKEFGVRSSAASALRKLAPL